MDRRSLNAQGEWKDYLQHTSNICLGFCTESRINLEEWCQLAFIPWSSSYLYRKNLTFWNMSWSAHCIWSYFYFDVWIIEARKKSVSILSTYQINTVFDPTKLRNPALDFNLLLISTFAKKKSMLTCAGQPMLLNVRFLRH